MFTKGEITYHRTDRQFSERWEIRLRINSCSWVKAHGPTKRAAKRKLRKLLEGSSLEKYVKRGKRG